MLSRANRYGGESILAESNIWPGLECERKQGTNVSRTAVHSFVFGPRLAFGILLL